MIQSSDEAGHAASQQVQELTRQVAELRRRAEEAEEKLTGRDAEITRVRLECLEREKTAVRRTKDEFEQALQAERRASEEAIQVSCSLFFCPSLLLGITCQTEKKKGQPSYAQEPLTHTGDGMGVCPTPASYLLVMVCVCVCVRT